MSDELFLFIFIIVLYFIECGKWFAQGAMAILTYSRNNWTLLSPNKNLSNNKGGIIFTNPMPPLSPYFKCNFLPLSISEEYIISFSSVNIFSQYRREQISQLIKIDDIKNIKCKNDTIFINDAQFLKGKNKKSIESLTKLIHELSKSASAKRQKIIENYFQSIMSTDDISGLKETYDKSTRILRLSCNILWFYIFLLSPVLIYFLGFFPMALYLIYGYGILHIITIFIFYKSYRQTFKNHTAGVILNHLLRILLYPPALIRSPDIISQNFLELYHPIAILAALGSKEMVKKYALKLYLDLIYPLGTSDLAKKDMETVSRFNEIHISELEKLTTRKGINKDSYTSVRPAETTDYAMYCPRCLTTYINKQKFCSDCGNIKLKVNE